MKEDALEAEISLHTQLLAFQNRQLLQLEEQCRLVRGQILTSEVALAFLRGAPREMGSKAEAIVGPRKGPAPGMEALAARQRSPARRMMIEALEAEGSQGMSAADLNDLVAKASMSKDTAEKSKAALKKEGVVGHDPRALRWYAAGYGPPDIEADRKGRAEAHAAKNEAA